MSKRWNVIALDRNERKAKKTKLDGVLTLGPTEWSLEVTASDDTLVRKSAKPTAAGGALDVGSTLRVGSFELELIDEAAMACAQPSAAESGTHPPPAAAHARSALPGRPQLPLSSNAQFKAHSRPSAAKTPAPDSAELEATRPTVHTAPAPAHRPSPTPPSRAPGRAPAPATARAPAPSAALAGGEGACHGASAAAARWALDAAADGHLIVDPAHAALLRPHQREGVQFMYDCLSGARGPGGGCILADTMGLGKTVQALTLLATLSRVRPFAPRGWREPVSLAAVVCPASLVRTWEAECGKWPHVRAMLGGQRMHALGPSTRADGPSAARLTDFLRGPRPHARLLILSYEQCRRNSALLADASLDLLICDEGHRLKASAGNQTIDALTRTRAPWRVLLSATPVQNNLAELWSMVNFVLPPPTCPLGSLADFRRRLAEPIEAARAADASPEARELGAERAAELSAALAPFTLRRDASVLRAFLPPRHEVLLFAPLSAEQACAYERARTRPGAAEQPLGTIAELLNVCAHPELAKRAAVPAGEDEDEAEEELLCADARGLWDEECDELPPPADAVAPGRPGADGGAARALKDAAASAEGGSAFVSRSAKLALAEQLLRELLRTPEKTVVVCRLRKSMAMLAGVCARLGADAVQLDGTTGASGRQELVDRFNACDDCRADAAFKRSGLRACAHADKGPRVFLLTARAGGVGLTIVGASRMVLFEADWNPAVDTQAMGRVYREGQTRPVHVYRLFCAHTLEEKVLQRQLAKRDVADEVVDGGAPPSRGARAGAFSRDELRELFAPYARVDGPVETVASRRGRHAPEPPAAGGAHAITLSAEAEQDDVVAALLRARAVDPDMLHYACCWSELEPND